MKRFCSAAITYIFLLVLAAHGANPTFRLLQLVQEVDSGGGPTPVFRVTFTYDDRNFVRVVAELDADSDGTMDRRSISTYDYEKQGNRILSFVESSSSVSVPDGIEDSRSTTTYRYDHRGRVVGLVREVDSGADGTVDFITRTSGVYDSRGNWIRFVQEGDSNADGVWDSSTIATRSYDAHNNVVKEVRETDGNVYLVITTDYKLDPNGKDGVAVTEIDFGPDGVVDRTERRTFTSDSRGRIISSFTESGDGNGIVYATQKVTYTYDNYGNLIRAVQEGDADGDGTVDAVQTTTYTYTRVNGGP